MTRASALDAAARSSPKLENPALAETSAEAAVGSQPSADRRLSDSNQAWLGKVVDGRYRVLEVIGRGGQFLI